MVSLSANLTVHLHSCPVSYFLHLHLHLSVNCRGLRGTTDDFTTSFLHFSLFSSALWEWDLANSKPVHSLMLSSHLFFYVLCLLPLVSISCKMVSARPDEWGICPYHFSLHLFTMVRRSSCGLIACWILEKTSSLGTWSLYEMRSILQWHLVSIACILLCSSAVRVF